MNSTEVLPFPERLKIGVDFEAVVAQIMRRKGWFLRLAGKNGQLTHGDTLEHVEIKRDGRFRDTGNLFIETRERRDNSGVSQWRPSGIYDDSDPWLLLIGDEFRLWLHSVTQLRYWEKAWPHKCTDTAEGFLIPVWWSDKFAIRVIEP